MLIVLLLGAGLVAIATSDDVSTTTVQPKVDNEFGALIYLQKYGYIESAPKSSALLSPEGLQQAVREFQRFAGLNETGELDEETLRMMNMPRCGVNDKQAPGARRKKRYALQGSKWRNHMLSYSITRYSRHFKDHTKIDKEIARAFKVWSEVTPLRFVKQTTRNADIEVSFYSRDHGDRDPFDGPGGTLAHAFFPRYGGDVHFDDDEKWTVNVNHGTNLFQVAAHELGHSLGLAHSREPRALMAPFYRGYQPHFQLDTDDILAIQKLYGSPSKVPANPANPPRPSLPPPDSAGAPDLCQDAKIDAVTKTADGNTFVFKGDHYWRVTDKGIADGYPRRISTDWNGLPGNLDAALTWSDGKTFFFKGTQYWRFRNMNRDPGYPKLISVGFEGIPNNVDAAFLWSGNGKTYFFKGDKYWRFDSRSTPPVSSRYPRPVSNWEGIPSNVDAAFQWNNGRTYFFKGRNYYRFNDRTFSLDQDPNPFPRSTSSWWFDCAPISRRLVPSYSSGLKEASKPDTMVREAEEDSPQFLEQATQLDLAEETAFSRGPNFKPLLSLWSFLVSIFLFLRL